MARKDAGQPPWERRRPADTKTKTLTPASRAKARARARAAARTYPNLVDNMWAAAQQRSRTRKPAAGPSRKTTGTRKKAAAKKRP